MKAIEMLQPYWEFVKRLFVYAQYCVESELRTPVCRDFWTWSLIASFAVAALIAFLVGKTVFREQLEFYRNRKRLEARKIVADEETMEEAKWKGEDAVDVELTHEELAAKMRESLNARAASAPLERAK